MDDREKYSKIIDARVEWCCPGRHGVVRNVTKREWHEEIGPALQYFYACGRKGVWATKTVKGVFDIEFCHQAKVFPAPKNPWEWCGETILFKDQQNAEKINLKKSYAFRIGQKVSFTYKNKNFTGLIFSINKRASIVVENDECVYYIPFDQIQK